MLREIAARLGVQIDDKEVFGFMSTLDKAKGAIVGLGAALLLGEFGHFIKDTIEAADHLDDMHERLGISTDEIQRLQYAMKLTGAQVDGLEKSLFIFSKTLGEAASAGGGDPFTKIGVQFKDATGNVKPMLDVLPDVADKIAEAKSEAERIAIATQFFGKSAIGLVPLLKRGREGLAEFAKEFDELGGGIDRSMIEQSGEFNDQLDRLHFVAKAAGANLVGALLPALMQIAKWVVTAATKINWLAKNTTLFKTGAVALAAILAIKLIPSVLSGVRAFLALRTAVFGATLPFWLVVAAIVALYLIFDDLWVLMNGGESVIGDLLDQFGEVGAKAKFVKSLKDAWQDLKDLWASIKPILEDLWKSLKSGAEEAGPVLIEVFKGAIKWIMASIKGISTLLSILDKADRGDWKGIMQDASKMSADIFGQTNKYWDKATGQMVEGKVGGLYGMSEKEWQAQMAAAGVVVNAPVSAPINAKVTVTVPPGTEPGSVGKATTDGVSKGVQGALKNGFNGAATYVDTAVTDSAPDMGAAVDTAPGK